MAATCKRKRFRDATGLPRGVSRCLLLARSKLLTRSGQRDPPRDKPVASRNKNPRFYSSKRQTPPGKLVASIGVLNCLCVRAIGEPVRGTYRKTR